MTKAKKITIAAAVIVILIIAFFYFTIWNTKKAAQEAINVYNASVEKYNAEIEPFNKAVNEIASENEELQKLLDRAKSDVDSGDEAYEPDTQEDLEKELKKAQKLLVKVPVLIDPFDQMELSGGFSKKEFDLQRQEAEASFAAVEEAETKVPEMPEVPDFSEAKKSLLEKCEAYEKSVQKLKNVTSPPESFVKERLRKIDTVVQTGAVTKEYDPNGLLGKKGGYTACVYFLDDRVDRKLLPADAFRETENPDVAEDSGSGMTGDVSDNSNVEATGDVSESSGAGETGTAAAAAGAEKSGAAETGSTAAAAGAEKSGAGETGSTAAAASEEKAGSGETAAETAKEEPGEKIDVVMIGTDGGGAVEIFPTREDAETRLEYLAFFDGSVMAAGLYDIEGTCVIRASKYLSEEQQRELIAAVRKALLEVE